MSTTTPEPTFGSMFGTPVVFFPVPTPWPEPPTCAKYMHRQMAGGTILAWDPIFPSIGPGLGAESCYPQQQSAWWFQSSNANPSTALGPTFVCPESYSKVHSTVLTSDLTAQTEYTYCCPPAFTLDAILPRDERSVIQCSSAASPGATLSYLSVTFLTITVIATGNDGTVSTQSSVQSTNIPTSTVVQSSAFVVRAPPVNGFNIVPSQNVTSSGATSNTATPPTSPQTTPIPTSSSEISGGTGQSSQVAPGTIAGAVVGAVVGLALLALGGFFLFRRRRQRPAAGTHDWTGLADARWRGAGNNFDPQQGAGAVVELQVKDHMQELALNSYAHELPDQGSQAVELPGRER